MSAPLGTVTTAILERHVLKLLAAVRVRDDDSTVERLVQRPNWLWQKRRDQTHG